MDAEANRLLNEILLYTRAQAAAAVRGTASGVLNSPAKARVYALLDGVRMQKEICDQLKLSAASVSTHVGSFVTARLAVQVEGTPKRFKALFSLEELGIDPVSIDSPTARNGITDGNRGGDGSGL